MAVVKLTGVGGSILQKPQWVTVIWISLDNWIPQPYQINVILYVAGRLEFTKTLSFQEIWFYVRATRKAEFVILTFCICSLHSKEIFYWWKISWPTAKWEPYWALLFALSHFPGGEKRIFHIFVNLRDSSHCHGPTNFFRWYIIESCFLF